MKAYTITLTDNHGRVLDAVKVAKDVYPQRVCNVTRMIDDIANGELDYCDGCAVYVKTEKLAEHEGQFGKSYCSEKCQKIDEKLTQEFPIPDPE